MIHNLDRALLEAFHDGELTPAERSEVQSHLNSCPECVASLADLRLLRAGIRESSLRREAPPYLAARIRASLPADTRRPPSSWLRWTVIAACLIAIAALPASLLLRPALSLSQQVVASHVRSLQVNHLFDVPSSDRHTVKPWFNGKLDFSPPVKDLSPDFHLAGGRLDYLDGRPVAALVYQRRLHVVNLFIWPDRAGDRGPSESAGQNGFNVVQWSGGGMQYWAVSDIPPAELKTFAVKFRE